MTLFILCALLLTAPPLWAHPLHSHRPARSKPIPTPLLPSDDLQPPFSAPSPVDPHRPPGLLDPLGRMMGTLPSQLLAQWRHRLQNPRIARLDACRLHLLLGEWELGQNEQPERALAHFETAERLAPLHSPEQGLAAYDRCLALYNEGAYAQSATAFLHLLKTHKYRAGFDRRNAAMWQRHAQVCAGYHTERARMGIPEPPKLDPLCGAAALAACLREQQLPYSKKLVLAHMHVTGKGSSLQDILDAARKLGVSAHAFRTDDAGLRALKSGCIVYLEHDHFAYVVQADQRGVSYLCSDCGPFPGGLVHVSYTQWHALEPTAYAVIAKPGSQKERRLQIALSGSEKAQGAAKHHRDQALLKAHPEMAALILHLVALQEPLVGDVCGYTNQSLQCPCYQMPFCPTDGGGGATDDPVELATGEECYTPESDISVYNPDGPPVVFARRLDSLRGWDPAYNSDDFGLGWSHNFAAGVYLSEISPCPLENGVPSFTLPATFSDPPQQGVWDIVCQDQIIASSANTQGWNVLVGQNSQTMQPTLTVTVGTNGATFAGYEVRAVTTSGVFVAATFATVAPGTVPRGLGSFPIPALTGTDLPTVGAWDVVYQGTVIANSGHPRGWYLATTVNGSTTTYSLAAPVTATVGNGYEFRYRPQLTPPGCRIDPRRGRRRTTPLTSTPFTVVDSRLYPWLLNPAQPTSYPIEIVEPGGGHIPLTFPAMPSAVHPQVQAQTLPGVPLIAYWNFDAHNPLGNYTIEFSDRTTWIVGDCNRVLLNTSTGAYITQDGHAIFTTNRVFGASYPLVQKIDRNNNVLRLVYSTPADSGFPMLAVIEDGQNAPLLTLNHATDGSGSLLSVTDRYGRSVYYHISTAYGAGETGQAPLPCYLLLDTVSQIVPTGTVNPPARMTYSYSYVANEITFNGETVPMLTSISVPSPTGTGTSTATITYAADTQFVTQIKDANGNTHSYQFTPAPPLDPQNFLLGLTFINQNQITVADKTGKVMGVYFVSFDQGMREITRTAAGAATAPGNVIRAMRYNNSADPYWPSVILDAKGYLFGSNPGWRLAYDVYGHVTSTISPYGVTTTYTWDYSHWITGELTQIQEGTRTPITVTYNEPSGLPATITCAHPGTVNNAATVTYNVTWDLLGNLTSITTPGNNATTVNGIDQGATTNFNYTQDGSYSQIEALEQPIAITDPAGKVTHLRYYNNASNPADPLANTGQLKSVVDPLGHEVDVAYNLVGQTVKVTAPATGETGAGQSNTQYSYLYPGGPITSTALYDESGTKVQSIAPVYGKEGEVLTTTGNVLPVTAVYDALYRVVSLTDGKQNVTTYQYTGDYLTQMKYPNGDTYQVSGLDQDGNITSVTDARQVVHTYQYNDPESHLTDATSNGAHPQHITYTYDNNGRLSTVGDGNQLRTYAYDDNDALLSLTNQFTGVPVAQQIFPYYYPDGSLEGLSLPGGAFHYTYSARGELTGLTNPAGDAFSWSYFDNGWLHSKQVGNAATTAYTYNAVGQLLEQKTTLVNGGGVLSDLTLPSAGGYDGAGDLLGLTTSLPSSPGAYSGTSNYSYDSLSQLTQESSTRQGSYNFTFAYDAAGNPTTFRSQAGLTYTSANQPLNGTLYDGDGNPQTWQTQALTFNDDDELIALGTQFQYGYSDGDRVWKQTPSGKTYFLNFGGTPLCELDGNGNMLATNTFGADGLCARTPSGSSSTFYSFDVQGGALLRLSTSGNVLGSYSYDAYGNRQSTDNSGDPYADFGAQWGYYRDAETGLSLLGARYYDPGQGRFLNRDPIGYDGGINLYSYSDNDPVGEIDPMGTDPCDDLARDIKRLRDQLADRYQKMRGDLDPSNKYPLYPYRPNVNPEKPENGTWPGHQKQFDQKQKALRKKLKQYTDNGCGKGGGYPIPADAWKWATTPCPTQPAKPFHIPYEGHLQDETWKVVPVFTGGPVLRAIEGIGGWVGGLIGGAARFVPVFAH